MTEGIEALSKMVKVVMSYRPAAKARPTENRDAGKPHPKPQAKR